MKNQNHKGAYAKRLDRMSLMAIFNESKNHLLSQMKKSVAKIHSDPTCAYHGPNGLKCAAGIFIPDSNYSPKFEGNGWADWRISDGLDHKKIKLIKQLQMIHDSERPSRWKGKLNVLEKKLIAEGAK